MRAGRLWSSHFLLVAGSLLATGLGTGRAAVPPPWTPVQITSDQHGISAHVWGRQIRFPAGPWPSQIVTAGKDLLAAPVVVVAETEAGPVQWSDSGVIPWESCDEKASLLGWQESSELVLNVYWEIEFDGLAAIDLKVVPPRKGSVKLTKLWLEIPLRSELIRLFHYWPGRWGSAANSGGFPSEGLKLPFKPVLWLGWEEGGLAVMAEDARSWLPADADRVLEVVPGEKVTTLRVHLLDSPPERLPTVFRLMLQPTPVKPWPSDFHSWHICHGASYGIESRPASGGESPLAKAARLGVRTLVFHEHWTPVQNYWKTHREAELRNLVQACHEKGIALWLYFGYELSTLAPEYGEWADRYLIRSPGGSLAGGYWRSPPQRGYMVCLKSPWGEKLLEGIIRAIDEYGFDGVYLDGTIEPFGCANQLHGCGYRARDGTLRETYPIAAVRSFMKRLYTALVSRGKRINAHQSTYCGPATLAFVHSYWDGEQLQSTLAGAEILKNLPLDAFRAEFMGRNFGVPCEFLVYEKPPQWTVEHAMAFTLLHDVRVRPGGIGGMLERIAPVWQVMEEFGVSQAEWHPYWRNDSWFSGLPPSVKVSGYRRVSEGRSRWLLVISNLSDQEEQAVLLEIRDPQLGEISEARDTLTGQAVEVKGRSLNLTVPPMRLRLIEIR